MATLALTQQQLDKVTNDMNSNAVMLSDSEIKALAQKINGKFNIPVLGETGELIVFAKIVKLIDRKLSQLLPNEFYKLVKDSTDGISKDEAISLEKRLTPLINDRINIPILSEDQEEKLISMVLGIIINAMVKGAHLEQIAPEIKTALPNREQVDAMNRG
jgi:hypothetical protein